MGWVGRDLADHLVPAPCHGQGHLPPDQGAQSPIPFVLLLFVGPYREAMEEIKISNLDEFPDPVHTAVLVTGMENRRGI